MSEVLARIRVRETAGIRRFLYPLTVFLDHTTWPDFDDVQVLNQQGVPQPSQLTPAEKGMRLRHRLDFAVSLAPLEQIELDLWSDMPPMVVNDPLQVTEEGGFHNQQQHFGISFGCDGDVSRVVYDSISHLRGRCTIRRNGVESTYDTTSFAKNSAFALGFTLNARVLAYSEYQDGCKAKTLSEITACKSWVTTEHRLEQPRPQDMIEFTLPLAITSPTLTCDIGVGSGIYGKLNGGSAPEVVWRTEFGDTPHARWSVETAGRTDYMGQVETVASFLPQRWFHLIDSDKALAVAITRVPPDAREMTVRLTHEGDVSIAFRLGDTITGPAEFGICYHFLNDVPAIAAATNPQSILLPPVVEVLPI